MWDPKQWGIVVWALVSSVVVYAFWGGSILGLWILLGIFPTWGLLELFIPSASLRRARKQAAHRRDSGS